MVRRKRRHGILSINVGRKVLGGSRRGSALGRFSRGSLTGRSSSRGSLTGRPSSRGSRGRKLRYMGWLK